MNKEKMEKAMELLGELTAEQDALILNALDGKISEKDLIEKLGVDEETFMAIMNVASGKKEEEVFNQELSLDELDDVAGGGSKNGGADCENGRERSRCNRLHEHYIYGGGGFPDCAATVEDGSWCGSNDACLSLQVRYTGMHDCTKAWR